MGVLPYLAIIDSQRQATLGTRRRKYVRRNEIDFNGDGEGQTGKMGKKATLGSAETMCQRF